MRPIKQSRVRRIARRAQQDRSIYHRILFEALEDRELLTATGNLDDTTSGFIVAPVFPLGISITGAEVELTNADLKGRDVIEVRFRLDMLTPRNRKRAGGASCPR